MAIPLSTCTYEQVNDIGECIPLNRTETLVEIDGKGFLRSGHALPLDDGMSSLLTPLQTMLPFTDNWSAGAYTPVNFADGEEFGISVTKTEVNGDNIVVKYWHDGRVETYPLPFRVYSRSDLAPSCMLFDKITKYFYFVQDAVLRRTSDGEVWESKILTGVVPTEKNWVGMEVFNGSIYLLSKAVFKLSSWDSPVEEVYRDSSLEETSYRCYGLKNFKGSLFLIGATGTLHSTSDGLQWSKETQFSHSYARNLTVIGEELVISGASGFLQRSSDGFSWRNIGHNFGNLVIEEVRCIHNQYFATVSTGVYVTSSLDFPEWKKIRTVGSSSRAFIYGTRDYLHYVQNFTALEYLNPVQKGVGILYPVVQSAGVFYMRIY